MVNPRHPPDIWNSGCLHPTILPPQGTRRGPYDHRSIAATMLLPKGNTRLLFSMSQSGPPAQPTPGLPPEQDSSLLPPLSEGDTRLNPTNTTPVLQGTTPTMGESSTLTTAPSARPSRGTPLRPLSRRDLLYMITTAKRVRATRTRPNARQHQSLITAHFLDLRPASLPVQNRLPAPTPLLPRSLPNLGWHRDPS
jgi:hypothetical protein